jgi:hypothetical protein
MNRRDWFTRLLALLAFLARPWETVRADTRQAVLRAAPPIWSVRWMWSGAVQPFSVTVVAKVVGVTGPLRLRVRSIADGAIVSVGARPAGDAPDVFRFVADGLRPATLHSYQIFHGETGWSAEGRFRTTAEGPHSAVVLFGSCASTGSNAAIWDTMRAVNADVFIHMGDLHYGNITRNEPRRFRDAFDRCLMAPRQSAFYRSLPMAYVWDDHDFGGDESDRHSSSASAAHGVYREYVPHYPLVGNAGGTIQQAFDIGRVRVIVTDVRSARDPRADMPTMLGAAQRQWLLDELESASRVSALVVWANAVPWITKQNEGTHHGWAPYHQERALIAAQIDRLGLASRLLMISGDAHMAAIDDGTNSQYAPGTTAGSKGFVVVHAAAFDRFRRNKGGPYSHGSRAGRGQFGELRIDDTGARIVATVTCRDRRGRQIQDLTIRLSCEGGSCAVSPRSRTAIGRGAEIA